MICSNCQTANPDGARFCMNCGSGLAIRCPNCQTELPAQAKYCFNCGQALSAPAASLPAPAPPVPPAPAPPPATAAPGSTVLHQYIPQEFLARLESAQSSGEMVGERRIVTMLFCDVKGSTAAASQLDPEEWAEIINGAFEHMIRPIYHYEGTVARLLGDGLLAFFGAPIAHEDDPQRAILAGLEIVQAIRAYGEQVRRRWQVDMDVRVGINTGLVVVGAMGSDLRMEYSALGDAINIAARMEQTAEPGTVQVAEATQRLVAPLFEFEDLGGIEVKGKEEPVHAYRVLARKRQPGRVRGIAGLEAPLVGRERERGQMEERLPALAHGIGGIVCLVGEAGLGKSRLILELSRSFQDRFGAEAVWYESGSLSYETAQPYALFQRLIRRAIGATAVDAPDRVQELLQAGLVAVSEAQRQRTLQVLEMLMGISAHSGAPLQLEGEGFRRELFEIMADLWRSWLQSRPGVLVFDDLHWADPASVALLEHLLQLTEELPLLLICALRPDREAAGWRLTTVAGAEYPHRYQEMALRPLSNAESTLLVDSLLNVADLPADLRRRILDKAAGNPFFVEEVVRTLVDSGAVVQDAAQGRWVAAAGLSDVDIPDTLQSLLLARVDRLEEQTRRTLQLAAVIGRSFYFQVLKRISESAQNLDHQVSTLLRVDLIREAARIPDLEYMFSHTLTQEAAYNSILLKRRREFHRRVGEAMEGLFGDRMEELAPVLAHHFDEAGELAKALDYHTLAGDVAFRMYAIPEAKSHYAAALELSRRLPDLATWLLVHLHTRYGRALELRSEYVQALAGYSGMLELAQEQADAALELAALVAQATLLAIPGEVQDAGRAQAVAERALQIADRLGDRAARARILWVLALLRMYSGRRRDSIPYGEEAAALAGELDLRELRALAVQDLSLAYIGVGRLADARAALAETRAYWEEVGNLPMLAQNLTNAVFDHLCTGRFEEAIALSEEAYRISLKIDNLWGRVNAHVASGAIYLAQGNIDRALEVLEETISAADRAGHPAFVLGRVQRCEVYLHLGALPQALQAAEEATRRGAEFAPFRPISIAAQAQTYLRLGHLAEAQQVFDDGRAFHRPETLLFVEVHVDRIEAELSLAAGRPQEALARVESLLAFVDAAGADYLRLEVLLLRATIWQALGRPQERRADLQEVRAAAARMAARMVLWQALAGLAALAQVDGDLSQAAALQAEAQACAAWIASHISDPELAAAFAARVASILPELEGSLSNQESQQ